MLVAFPGLKLKSSPSKNIEAKIIAKLKALTVLENSGFNLALLHIHLTRHACKQVIYYRETIISYMLPRMSYKVYNHLNN